MSWRLMRRWWSRQSKTDSLDAAMDELDESYYEEDIRLVRIKFLSEMAI